MKMDQLKIKWVVIVKVMMTLLTYNPKNLKKLCSGFVDTIQEKNKTINMYKRMAINSNLQLVRMDSAYQRKMRIHYLTKSRTRYQDKQASKNSGDSGETEKDPLTLFPEEVWTVVFSQVTEARDLLSLSRTCLLFQEILNKTKNQWLFEKVFPYLFNYLPRKDILQCRFVSKQWSSFVDAFLENYKSPKAYFGVPKPEIMKDSLQEPNIFFKRFCFEYRFYVPFTQNLAEDSSSEDDESSNDANSVRSSRPAMSRPKNKFIEAMRLHSTARNPFIGRSVTIEEEPFMDDNWPQFLPHSKTFLNNFGNNIWHLSISCCSGMQTPLELWRVINCSLEKCTNLKSFSISGFLNGRSLQGLLSASEDLPDRPSLEAIKFDMYNKCVIHLQDKLVSKFSGQLKLFEAQIWREEIYESLDWGNLRELRVLKGNSMVIIESLMKTEKIGNLQKLVITVGLKGNGNILEGLVKLTRKFSQLSDLVLKFEHSVGVTGTGLKRLCEERLPLGMVVSKNLISLEIHSEIREIVNYDFLVYFPYINRLTIKHCHRRFIISRLSTQLIGQDESKEGTGILNIGKYLAREIDANTGEYDLKRKIYGKSNIWGYLPFLKVFTVYSGVFVEKYRKVLTRHVYEQYWRKNSESVLE